MAKGFFIASDGSPLYFGTRADRPSLEAGNTFVDVSVSGMPPGLPLGSNDAYYWKSSAWELQVDINKPSDQQRIDKIHRDPDKLHLDFLAENRLRVLEGLTPHANERDYVNGQRADLPTR